jgi:hypothetical protein
MSSLKRSLRNFKSMASGHGLRLPREANRANDTTLVRRVNSWRGGRLRLIRWSRFDTTETDSRLGEVLSGDGGILNQPEKESKA